MEATVIERAALPSILVSYAYRKSWTRAPRIGVGWREVVLDSGAFTVKNSGGVVDLVEFADWAHEQVTTNKLVTEVFTLDVIGGDWRESLRNTEYLWKRGVKVIPVYHYGEPTHVLKALAKDYPKIALGGAVGSHGKLDWAALCFKHAWPAKIHGLGFGPAALDRLPFHTIDHTALRGALRYAQYEAYGGTTLALRHTHKHSIGVEIEHQLTLEMRARRRWAGRLPADWGDDWPAIRVVGCAGSTIELEQLVAHARSKGAAS